MGFSKNWLKDRLPEVMRLIYLIIVLLIFVKIGFSQGLEKEYHQVTQTFIECIQNENIKKLKGLVVYPLQRQYPLPPIENENDFQERFGEVFDDSLVNIILQSDLNTDWAKVGQRGIMLQNGTIWLDETGKLLSVNYQSNTEKIKRNELIELDKNTIHTSLRDFEEPILYLETEELKVRIDQLEGDNYRLAYWSIQDNMNEAPKMILENGIWLPEGSGGNHSFEFSEGIFRYVCVVQVLGEIDHIVAFFETYEGEKKIISQQSLVLQR